VNLEDLVGKESSENNGEGGCLISVLAFFYCSSFIYSFSVCIVYYVIAVILSSNTITLGAFSKREVSLSP